MTVVIDPAVLKTPGGSTMLDTLQKAEVKYEIVAQPLPNIVTFWREVTKVTETEPQQVFWGECSRVGVRTGVFENMIFLKQKWFLNC